jgi:O-antigen/teichoic acid export membrane protein
MSASDITTAAQPVSRASRRQMTSNALVSLLSSMISLPVSLLLSRFVVHQIGLGAYGIWAALGMLVGYGGLLDLGVRVPLIKYTAEYMALGRERDINVLLSSVMVLYASVSAVFVLVMTLGSGWLLSHVLHAGQHDSTIRLLYFAMVVGFAVSFTFGILRSLLEGLQRADLSARLNLGFNLTSAAGTVLVLMMGLGVPGLAANWLLVTGIITAASWALAKGLVPSLALNPFLFSVGQLKPILSFSVKAQVTSVTLMLNDQVDRTLIAYALGTTPLGYYQLAAKAGEAVRGLSFALMGGVMPAISDLAAVGHGVRLREMYVRTSRYLAILDFGLCAGIAGLALPLIRAWLGPGYGQVAITLIIILAGYAIWLPSQSTSDPLNGISRPDIRMHADLAFLFVHVPLSILLIWRFGYFGTVIGTTFSLSSTRLYIYWRGPRALGVPVTELLRRSYLQPAAGATLALFSVALPQVLGVPFSFVTLLAEGSVFVAVYLGYITLVALDAYDRELLHSAAQPLLRFFARALHLGSR